MNPGAITPAASSGVMPGTEAPGAITPSGVGGTNTPADPGAQPVATDPMTGLPVSPTPGTQPQGNGPDTTNPTPTTTDMPPPATGTCQPGVPITSQIPRLTNLQYDTVVKDIFNVSPASGKWSDSFEADTVGELPSTQWANYLAAADKIAAAVVATPVGQSLTCADGACLDAGIKALGRQMFRRPLTDAEVAKFTALKDLQPAGTPEEIAAAIVYSMLISPSFLTRAELDAPEVMVPGTDAAPQMAHQLSDYEVAARLSFMLWGSVPDQVLADAADAKELETKEQIAAQAARMVGPEFKDRVMPVINGAHRFYANISDTSSTSRWGKMDHDTAKFPEYLPAQKAATMAEMDALFADIGYNGKFEDLFLSNVAYVNADTAGLYGLNPADYGADLTRVELDAMARPGFITRAAFLSSFAHPDSTAPILRGAFLIRIMGGQTGVPDPNALKTPIPDGTYATNAEATKALTSVQDSCKSCHWTNINPPGFVLENFSAVGSIQTKDPVYGGDITTAVDAVNFPAGSKPINNAFELMTEIAAGRATKEIYAEKYVSYATGREANDYDTCTAIQIADKIEAGNYSLASVLPDITQADSFRLRVAGE
ncbi:MAG TPA: DUF1592 domain-containing protein [Polyangiaceae bacterium]|nr:DUF1592 domain-containing protein [Polyangiaceae bacterium]